MKITDLQWRIGHFSLRIGHMLLPSGKVYGLIGPNGCGKTTLLNLLAGVNRVETGIIDYEGCGRRDITHLPRRPYMLHGSVYTNLVYPLKLRGITPKDETVRYWLETIKLCGERYAPGLSGGERQKLALARALIFSPRLILADEAFSNLDMESIDLFEQQILQRQAAAPVTWLIVSHHIASVSRLCDYAFFMNDGEIKAEGTMGSLLAADEPASLVRYLRHEGFER